MLDAGTFAARAAHLRLLLFDVDGVLTDGGVIINSDGTESKRFGIRDGIALVWAQRAGLRVGLLSARSSPTTPHRAAQLGITLVHQGVTSKAAAYDEILTDLKLSDAEVAYMGDDIVDLAVMARVGLSGGPADAVREVRDRAHWISVSPAGNGAVREFVEAILRARGLWDEVVSGYLREGARV